MSFRRIIQAAQENFGLLSSAQNVLVLHPQFQYHTPLIAALLNSAGCEALYITLPKPVTTLELLWECLARELADIYQIDLSPLPGLNGTQAAERFCQAIMPHLPLYIVLSAYDCADAAVEDFVVQVAQLLGTKGRVLLCSRFWPGRFVSRCEPGSISVIPTASDDMLLDYLDRHNNKVCLEVRALGVGQVFVNGRRVTEWDGALPRSLFFYFVDRGMTTRDEVFSTFWPELTTREATNVFHVTKRKISEILGVDLTVYQSGFYRISPQIDLCYDVITFAEAVTNSAVAPPDEARVTLERAVALHGRAFLSDLDQNWALQRREELLRSYSDALSGLARLYEDQGRNADALGLYSRAYGASPQREDLARCQMRLYQQQGRRDHALAVYDRLVEELQSALGVPPSPETNALADEIRAVM